MGLGKVPGSNGSGDKKKKKKFPIKKKIVA